ncbi:MAG: hypothetical protein ACKVVP_19590 [Chloroflexota bacterium]
MKRTLRHLLTTSMAALVGIAIAQASPGYAQEFTIDGTLDCGAESEEYCPIRDKVVLISESVSGVKERVTVHIDWIKDQWIYSLPLQDDYYVLQVFSRPNGGVRAVGILDHLSVQHLDSKRDPRDGRKESDRKSDSKKN